MLVKMKPGAGNIMIVVGAVCTEVGGIGPRRANPLTVNLCLCRAGPEAGEKVCLAFGSNAIDWPDTTD